MQDRNLKHRWIMVHRVLFPARHIFRLVLPDRKSQGRRRCSGIALTVSDRKWSTRSISQTVSGQRKFRFRLQSRPLRHGFSDIFASRYGADSCGARFGWSVGMSDAHQNPSIISRNQATQTTAGMGTQRMQATGDFSRSLVVCFSYLTENDTSWRWIWRQRSESLGPTEPCFFRRLSCYTIPGAYIWC